MRFSRLIAAIFLVVFSAACARLEGPTLIETSVQTPSPAQTTNQALTATDLGSFIDPAAEPQLTAKDKLEAASAQYYALQFGRPGAPRNWQGDSGSSGKIFVGPYVRVNNLDCREFTHEVTVNASVLSRKGTACRENDGSWRAVGD